jgi:broad specificity phosphatase PhoE
LTKPARFDGGAHNAPLAPVGVRQAEATRDFLAIRPIDHCYSSPLLRALQTAAIVAAPHGLTPQPLAALAECLPSQPESAETALEHLLQTHAGASILVVGHPMVNQTYLAGLLGMPAHRARQVQLDHCAISVVVRQGQETTVRTLNAAFHLQGVAA